MTYLTIATQVKNEALNLPEWIAFHEVVGVERFVIYDNGSTDNTRDLLEERPNVDVIHWPGASRQLAMYEAALRRARECRFGTRWLAFIDVDEFPYSPTFLPVSTILREFEHTPAVGVCWAMHGTSGHPRLRYMVVGSYGRRARQEEVVNRHVKSIIQPALIEPHRPLDSHHFQVQGEDELGRPLDGPFAQSVTWKRLRLNHYVTKSVAEAREKASIPRPDNEELRQWLVSPEALDPYGVYGAVYDSEIFAYEHLVRERMDVWA